MQHLPVLVTVAVLCSVGGVHQRIPWKCWIRLCCRFFGPLQILLLLQDHLLPHHLGNVVLLVLFLRATANWGWSKFSLIWVIAIWAEFLRVCKVFPIYFFMFLHISGHKKVCKLKIVCLADVTDDPLYCQRLTAPDDTAQVYIVAQVGGSLEVIRCDAL